MKLDNETIVHRYGKALFELAEEMKIRNEFHSELQEYKKVLQNEPQLKVFMSSNQISPEAKLKIMEILKKELKLDIVKFLTKNLVEQNCLIST